MGFDMSGPSKYGCWAKSHGTHIAPLFLAGEISFPRLEKYRILNLLVVGNKGPLMLVCSNTRVTRGFSIFGNTFNVAFWGFPEVRNPYNRLQGNGFFFATCWFCVFDGYVWLDATRHCRYSAFPITPELNVQGSVGGYKERAGAC